MNEILEPLGIKWPLTGCHAIKIHEAIIYKKDMNKNIQNSFRYLCLKLSYYSITRKSRNGCYIKGFYKYIGTWIWILSVIIENMVIISYSFYYAMTEKLTKDIMGIICD